MSGPVAGRDLLCTDGERWLTAGDLAGLAPRADEAAGVLRLDPGDPARALARLRAVRAAGGVAVLTDPTRPAAAEQALAWAQQAGPDPRDALLVLLTSGSGGAPRAVLRTARSWQVSHEPFSAATGLGPGDVVWAPGGLAATLTLFALDHALAGGLPALASGVWRGVERAGPAAAAATAVHCVPAVLSDILAARGAGRLPLLRTAVVAGAPTPEAVRARAGDLGIRLVEYYGAAELSFVAIDADGTGLRAFGRAEPDVREGRIWVRSPYLARGYLGGTPGPWQEQDGWATVGDLGRLGVDGVLTVQGRGERAVNVGGATVSLAEVEALLGAVAGVLELVCVGEPHARLGERIVAAVRPERGADPVPALRRAARAGLAPAARPVRYVLISQLPRTDGGKVALATLREQVTRRGGSRAVR